MRSTQERYGQQLGKTERKGHKVKRKDRHGTFCALSETLASSAFTIHPPINPVPRVHHIKQNPRPTGNRTATRKRSIYSAMSIKNL
jgi:hypothetical protein